MSARAAVRALLKAKVEGLGYTVFEYRDEDDAVTDEELPFVLIQQAGAIEVSRREDVKGGTLEHIGSFFLSSAARTRDAADAMMTAIADALLDDYSLGGRVQEVVAVSYGDEEDEGRDYAAVVLEVRITFCTAHDDFSTLI
jgi:hypothetical protein